MKKIYFLILTILSSFFLNAQTIISGKIIDATSKEPLPFVNISINNTSKGFISDMDGKFSFKSNQQIQTLKFSYIGYSTKIIEVNDKTNYITIALHQKKIELQEVNVYPTENPAHRIINEAINRKKSNNPNSLYSYEYDIYNKMIFAPEIDTAKFNSITQKDTSDWNLKKYMNKNHLFLTETVSHKYYKNPNKNKQMVLASKTSGFSDPILSMMFTQMQNFSIYDDFINLGDKIYLSPFVDNSHQKYFFLIEDTTYQDNDSVFIISYRPKRNKNFDGLNGLIYINSNNYAIQNFIAEPNIKEGSIGIKIQHQAKYTEGQWFPEQITFKIIFNSIRANNYPVQGSGKSYIYNIKKNTEIKNSIFSNVEIDISKDATKKDSTFWSVYRAETIDEKDLSTYKKMDSVGKANKIDEKIKLMKILTKMKLPLGVVAFDLDKILKFNDYEGFRLGLGISTTDALTKHGDIGVYAAYGLKDQAKKYGGSININLNKAREFKVGVEYANDVNETGEFRFLNDTKFSNHEFLRNYLINRMDKNEIYKFYLSFRALDYLECKIFNKNTYTTYGKDYQYTRDFNQISLLSPENYFSEIGAQFRYAYKEKYLSIGDFYNFNVGTNYPILWLNFAYGNKDILKSDYEYYKADAKLSYKKISKTFGTSYFTVLSGITTNTAPLNLLNNGLGNYSEKFGVIAPVAFQTIRVNEFWSDRYVYLFYTQDFGRLLFKTKFFKPEIALNQNIGFGNIKNPQLHYNTNIKSMQKGYFESGITINNILKNPISGLGIGAFYRYGAYSFDNWKDNLSIKMSLKFNF